MFCLSDYLSAKTYSVIMGVSYSTAKRHYRVDREILNLSRKMTIKDFIGLYGYSLEEINDIYQNR